ncbi:MAG: S24 family peptidase [Rhodospirillaceae bacterium]|nr:S24 family peptidase [Rhodospirillaceae bacterium]
MLSHQDAAKLAEVLGCETEELHHAERPPRQKGPARKKRRRQSMDPGPVPLAAIPEVDVEASAGPGALGEEVVAERAGWFLPEGMIRYEGGAGPGAIRVLRVRGESMEPELSEGDRLLVDTARRVPETGEMFVLWDGGGLVVKRVEHVRADGGAPELRLKSANPDYADYTCLAEDVHIVGKVLWTVRRV